MSRENQIGMPNEGWADIWHESRDVLDSARREFALPLANINPEEYMGVTLLPSERAQFGDLRVCVIPTPAELAAAPKSVRRVLKDIGVSFEDVVTVSLVIYQSAPIIGLRIVPDVIDENHVGLEVSNGEYAQSLIEMRTKKVSSEVETNENVIMETPLYLDKDTVDQLISTDGTLFAYHIREAYAGFSGNFDGLKLHTKPSPIVSKIVIKGAKWVNSMVEARKIPVQTLIEQPATE